MKKIPTLFIREYENHKVVRVTREFTNDECKKAFLEGRATIKFDGSCCAVIDGKFYKRYDAKKGKPIPEGAIKCQEEADEITGHLPCWIEVKEDEPSDKWFIAAFKTYEKKYGKPEEGTYEAIGKHFQGNPYKHDYDILVPHGKALCKLDSRTFEFVKTYLASYPQEGIVFWLNGKPVCKIKRTDFGYQWPIREEGVISRKPGKNNERNQEIECMIGILRVMNDQNARAVVVEEWIQKNGPLPNEYGEEVRQILMDEEMERVE